MKLQRYNELLLEMESEQGLSGTQDSQATSLVRTSEKERDGRTTKRWRKNTPEEKQRYQRKQKLQRRKEKAERKAHKHSGVSDVDLSRAKTEAKKYKGMKRTYWDRWQWELQKRQEGMPEVLPVSSGTPMIHKIDPTSLNDLSIDGKPTEVYIGRGSFSVIRLQYYRAMKVAVKEFLPRCVKANVNSEATILSLLNHPNLPYIFGMCISSTPYRIVIQFHGIGFKTLTLFQELTNETSRFNDPEVWLLFCCQIADALRYLHEQVHVVHNDIKSDNIVNLPSQDIPSTSAPCSILPSSSVANQCPHHVVKVDFGKARTMVNAKKYDLSETDKAEHLKKYPHIALEVLHGQQRQSQCSDMYSVGRVFQKLADNNCFSGLPEKGAEGISTLTECLTSVLWHARPTAKECLNTKLFS